MLEFDELKKNRDTVEIEDVDSFLIPSHNVDENVAFF
jgi:hypothetical protein